MSYFFVKRPRSALVLSILITLAGLICVTRLPINMYPVTITPPVVEIIAHYPGASASTIEKAVVAPLENSLNGVKKMNYITSQSNSDGSAIIRIYFENNTDPDLNTINTQNRIAQTIAKLPDIVIKNGITVRQGNSDNRIMAINLYSPEGTMNAIEMSNYADRYILDALTRIPNVSTAFIMAPKRYSMRVWLNPTKMHALNITVEEINQSIQEQNAIIAAGSIGASPAPEEQAFTYNIESTGRLTTTSAFENIILKADHKGGYIRLKDVAVIQLGAQNYSGNTLLNGNPTALISITQTPNSSALQVAHDVRNQLKKLENHFPKNLKAKIVFDTTEFISISIHEVIKTLMEAIVLVILIVFIFLQNLRATLIPALTIPISLIGAFSFMYLLDISINVLTLFALLLAIGIVVDDAIIVVENVERHIRAGLSPKQATQKSMHEIINPIIATTLVLLAVFGPVAFIPGVNGKLFQQFSLVLTITVLISAVNALTLSPALCSLLLQPHTKKTGFINAIDHSIQKITQSYHRSVNWLLKKTTWVGLCLLLLTAGTTLFIKALSTGFIPTEDQGLIFVNVQLPSASSLQRTDAVMKQLVSITLEQPGVSDINTTSGYNLLSGTGTNHGFAIVTLENWKQRTSPSKKQTLIQAQLQEKLNQIPNAHIQVTQPPTINTGDETNDLYLHIEDPHGRSPQVLQQTVDRFVTKANQQPELKNVFSNFQAHTPMYQFTLDRNKAKVLGVSLNDVYLTLQTQFGSLYVNEFTINNKIYDVILQAHAHFREQADDLSNYYVRNNIGNMVAISNFATLTPIYGASTLHHFNIYRAATVNSHPSPGYSTGQAIQTLQHIASSLPEGYTVEWSGRAAQEIIASHQSLFIFIFALLFIYLILTALYESWILPLVVLIIMPVALFGASCAMYIFNIPKDIYCQIGLLLLIGMTAKTTILITEFSIKQRYQGLSIVAAALAAAKLRFRAVTMTTLSFILGVLPLIFSSGAGVNSRFNIGITIIGGMITVATAGILFTPIAYKMIERLREHFSLISRKTTHS